jgi:uncharacterized membrane protein
MDLTDLVGLISSRLGWCNQAIGREETARERGKISQPLRRNGNRGFGPHLQAR